MTDFNQAARSWDSNNIHVQRSEAIAAKMLSNIEFSREMDVLEFGAGTGILSMMLAERFNTITMMDSATEMVAVMQEKVAEIDSDSLKPVHFDMTSQEFTGKIFDGIFTQMALHHVSDVSHLLNRFFNILKRGGFLVVADLYSEDGSFHGDGFDGHNGFDVPTLEGQMLEAGFARVRTETCFVMKKGSRDYPIFLMIAYK